MILPRGTEVRVNADLSGLPNPFRATVWDFSLLHNAYALQPIEGLYGADGPAIVGHRFAPESIEGVNAIDLLADVGRRARASEAYVRGLRDGLRLQTGEITVDQLCAELADDPA